MSPRAQLVTIMWRYRNMIITLRASCGAVYCNRSCLCVGGWVGECVCGWVCYHDNSKLRASQFRAVACIAFRDDLKTVLFRASFDDRT